MKASVRSLKVGLPFDEEELFSPLPNGARFNWSTLTLEIVAASSVEAASPSSKTKFLLIRSLQLMQEEWQVAREASKIFLISKLT